MKETFFSHFCKKRKIQKKPDLSKIWTKKKNKESFNTGLQTSANTSTWYCYSEKIQNLPVIQGQKPRWSGGNSSLQIKFELVLQNLAFTICALCLLELLRHAQILSTLGENSPYTNQYFCKHSSICANSNRVNIRHSS